MFRPGARSTSTPDDQVQGATVLEVRIHPTSPPIYRINLFPPSGQVANCFETGHVAVYIPTGNGDLSDRAEVRKTEQALEMLDVLKLARITKTPVNAQIDRNNVVSSHCALKFVSF